MQLHSILAVAHWLRSEVSHKETWLAWMNLRHTITPSRLAAVEQPDPSRFVNKSSYQIRPQTRTSTGFQWIAGPTEFDSHLISV